MKLTVKDAEGLASPVTTKAVTVAAAAVNKAPTAAFTRWRRT